MNRANNLFLALTEKQRTRTQSISRSKDQPNSTDPAGLFSLRKSLGRAITLVESTHPNDRPDRLSLIELCSNLETDSVRIGVTGPPGVGKSSLIERLGMNLINQGFRVAVLAIDPTSNRTGGSILGDKTRMEMLSRHSAAFVRPSPASGALGGVTASTRESILLCEAAGFDRILIETVGVGQSETQVASLTDVTMLVTMAGSGDDLQGIKRGILEVVDLVAVNKYDGKMMKASSDFATQISQALRILRGAQEAPHIQLTSATVPTGIPDLAEALAAYMDHAKNSGHFEVRRASQTTSWYTEAILRGLGELISANPEVQRKQQELLDAVRAGSIHPVLAAEDVLATVRDN